MDTLPSRPTCCVAVDEVFLNQRFSCVVLASPVFTDIFATGTPRRTVRLAARDRPLGVGVHPALSAAWPLTFGMLPGVLQHVELRPALLPFARRVFNFGSARGNRDVTIGGRELERDLTP